MIRTVSKYNDANILYLCEGHYASLRVEEGLTRVRKHLYLCEGDYASLRVEEGLTRVRKHLYLCEGHYVSFRVEEGLTQVRKHSGSIWSVCFIEG